MTTNRWIRKAVVKVGPLEEWRGGGNSSLAVVISGDGSQTSARIKFNIVKHVVSTTTPSTITIYNLSDELKGALRRKNTQVSLAVGWLNTEMILLFTGSLLSSLNHGGPDIGTDLICMAGYGGTSRTVISQTFSGGISVKDIVLDLAKQIPSVTVDPKNVDIPETKRMGGQGWSFVGPVNEALDKLSRTYGFSWHIDNKIFRSVTDGGAIGSETPLISYKNGLLIKAEPTLTSPFQVQTGITITSLLHPGLKPGGRVQVESKLNPSLNNTYAIHGLTHTGDTGGSQWESRIESKLIGGA